MSACPKCGHATHTMPCEEAVMYYNFPESGTRNCGCTHSATPLPSETPSEPPRCPVTHPAFEHGRCVYRPGHPGRCSMEAPTWDPWHWQHEPLPPFDPEDEPNPPPTREAVASCGLPLTVNDHTAYCILSAGHDGSHHYGWSALAEPSRPSSEMPPCRSETPSEPPHVHECNRPEDASEHSVCRCDCGATAFNTMGEAEWSRATETPSDPKDEDVAWLIERDGASGPEWVRHIAVRIGGEAKALWTPDANLAQRFASKAEGELAVRRYHIGLRKRPSSSGGVRQEWDEDHAVRVTEHMWLNRAAPSSGAAERLLERLEKVEQLYAVLMNAVNEDCGAPDAALALVSQRQQIKELRTSLARSRAETTALIEGKVWREGSPAAEAPFWCHQDAEGRIFDHDTAQAALDALLGPSSPDTTEAGHG